MNADDWKRASRGFGIDMGGDAVARRIDVVSRLREMGLALKRARILGPACEQPAPPPPSPPPPPVDRP